MEGPYLANHHSGKGRQVFLGNDPLTIGRHGDNRLVINDTMASRYHCHISKSPNGAVMLRDMNSSNGTAVNGHLIKYTRLNSGDTITIGKVRMIFTDPDAQNGEATGADVEVVPLGRPNPARFQQQDRKQDDGAMIGASGLLAEPEPFRAH